MQFNDGLAELNIEEEEYIPNAKSWNGKVYGSVKNGFYICYRNAQPRLTPAQAKYVKNHAEELLILIHGEKKGRDYYHWSML